MASSASTPIVPRGQKVTLPHGGLPEIVSGHLLKLIAKTGGRNGPIGRQFLARPELEKRFYKKKSADPLIEDHHEVAPGLVYKYRGAVGKNGEVIRYGRVLWTVTRFCASYCRFCTRGREVGLAPNTKSTLDSKASIALNHFLTVTDIRKVFSYLKKHKEINEVILSGGDPMTAAEGYLSHILLGLAELQQKGHLHIVRIGSRLPIHNPLSIKPWHYALLARLRNPYLMLHINHPAELTPETLAVLNRFRKESGATLMSQTVLLKGVNDNTKTLITLFNLMAMEGIRPYYVFQNDPVYWAQHFTVPMKRAIHLWQKVRPQLSGVAATARFVIDVPFGYGKVPVPEGNAWDVSFKEYRDFKGRAFNL